MYQANAYTEKTCIRLVSYAIIHLCFPSTALFNNVPVTIVSNVTNGTVCYNQSIQLTCHANGTVVTHYNWTSTVFKQAIETASITVVATHDPIEYNCMVTDINDESGYSSVNISSNGELNHIGYINTVYNVEYNVEYT